MAFPDNFRVLTIDDSRVLRMIVKRALAAEGAEVIEAEDGNKGLEVARRERPQLVLLDYHMPGMNGRETLQALRECPELKGTAVIMLTTEATTEAVTPLMEMGLQGFIVKPFDAAELVAKALAVAA